MWLLDGSGDQLVHLFGMGFEECVQWRIDGNTVW
jgi:hypothetical protein